MHRATSASALLALCGLLVVVAAPSSEAAVQGYRFIIPEATARPGQTVRLKLRGEYERSAQGFVFAARYPAAGLAIEKVDARNTILEAIRTDFIDVQVSPENGTLVISVLVDTLPPFEGQLIPNIGFALDLLAIEARVLPEARGELRLELADGISTPPVRNIYAVDNAAIPVRELRGGIVRVDAPTAPPAGAGASFRRGDASLDSLIDLVDPVLILRHIFSGDTPPVCLQAADANDDDLLDISDPIFILEFLFLQGPPPPAPFPHAGLDPTPGRLDCGLTGS